MFLLFSSLSGSFYPVNPVFSYFVETEYLKLKTQEEIKQMLCAEKRAHSEDRQDGHLQYLKHDASLLLNKTLQSK